MELGGLRTERDMVFLLSTTRGPETASLAAFRAVVHAYRTEDPIGRMESAGRLLARGVEEAVAEFGTLFLQEMLRRGGLPSRDYCAARVAG